MSYSLPRLILFNVLFALLLSFNSQAAEQTWVVNLKGADIRAFVMQVADITGYRFVLDPRVKGRVTVVSSVAMNKDAIYEMFLAVLDIHGFAAITGKDVIKIIQKRNARHMAQNDRFFLSGLPTEQIVTRVISLNNARALELVPILRPMVANFGYLAGVAGANALIFSDHLANILRISKIIKELDSSAQYQLEVVPLKEAWVGDMVKLLEALVPGELRKSSRRRRAKVQFKILADPSGNRLILGGDESFLEKAKGLIAKLDQPSSYGGKTKVVHLKNADATDLAKLLTGLEQDRHQPPGRGRSSGVVTKTSIYADDELNALVIRADPAKLEQLISVITQLDVRRAQVLIEVAIVEISDNRDDALGVQWALLDNGANLQGALTNFNVLGLSAAKVIGALVAKDGVANGELDASTIGSPSEGLTAGAGGIHGRLSWGALIQALEDDASANVLSTPKLLTLDNQESSIIVGDNIPIITGHATSSGADVANPFTTVERQDVGVKLIVTPSIGDGDVLRLEIEQEISGVKDTTVGADITTTKRQIKTSVLADNGETIILGGLITDQVITGESKVPLLGDIPWLGRLFSSSTEKAVKQNLVVFLRPTILRDAATAKSVTEVMFDKLWQLNLALKLSKDEDLKQLEKPSIERCPQMDCDS